MSKFIKGAILFVIGMALMFGLFSLGMTLFNEYYLAVLFACGLVYFAVLYFLESWVLAIMKLSQKIYILSTMAAPFLFAAVGLLIVKLASMAGAFTNGSFADLAWIIVLTVILVISGVSLAVRGVLLVIGRSKNKSNENRR